MFFVYITLMKMWKWKNTFSFANTISVFAKQATVDPKSAFYDNWKICDAWEKCFFLSISLRYSKEVQRPLCSAWKNVIKRRFKKVFTLSVISWIYPIVCSYKIQKCRLNHIIFKMTCKMSFACDKSSSCMNYLYEVVFQT